MFRAGTAQFFLTGAGAVTLQAETTDQLPDSVTLTCATRGSRARAAALIVSSSVTLSAKDTRSSGEASV